jgi:hypothetical protein
MGTSLGIPWAHVHAAYTHICLYIHIYIEKEREIERYYDAFETFNDFHVAMNMICLSNYTTVHHVVSLCHNSLLTWPREKEQMLVTSLILGAHGAHGANGPGPHGPMAPMNSMGGILCLTPKALSRNRSGLSPGNPYGNWPWSP